MQYPQSHGIIIDRIRSGLVIPASPLALDGHGRFDPRRQTALMRYYLAAGAGGVAVAVHTTQFAIRKPEIGLLEPVLETCAAAIDGMVSKLPGPPVKIAGIVGRTPQAVREAGLAASLGYHAGLLSLSAFGDATIDEMIAHAEEIAGIIPLFGFYLQPSVGGRLLSHAFWRRFVRIPNVIAIKIAPFNRYQTIDVVRAVADEGREREIALYTGNDDTIISDLLTPFRYTLSGVEKLLRIRGGLLGQWAVGTARAVEILARIHALTESGRDIPSDLLSLNAELTDVNAALFDAANSFAGCIPGIHEILRRQGLLEGTHTLDPDEVLSPGQMKEIDRVHNSHPHLFDDEFILAHKDEWM